MAASQTGQLGNDQTAALQASILEQGHKVRELKAAKASPEEVKAQVDVLLELKKQMELLTVGAGGSASGSKKGSSGGKLVIKTPKGTRDWEPLSMALRSQIFSKITKVFETHGAVTIDTPVFELKEILTGKYGEDGGKLIYDLQDQGGELCSLRYDLTVPFARFVAMNPSDYGTIKRYHIAKVYRRDQPVMTKGRFREFYQCDIDIAGVYDPMVPDAEVLSILVEALEALEMGEFTIKINHRKILDAIFSICGVPEEKIRTISSAVDKLDKSPWSEVKREMVVDKGLDESIADHIGEYVKLKGSRDLLEKLEMDEKLSAHPLAAQGLKDMALLFNYLDIFGVTRRMSFDLSLARGLDYYTGIIYEAVTSASAPPGFTEEGAAAKPIVRSESSASSSKKSKKKPEGEDEEVDESTVGVGSIAAGGRYDNLVGMFSNSKKPDAVPCVGVSIGVERVFAIKMQQLRDAQARGEPMSVRPKKVEVFVMNMGDGLLAERMQVAKMLWDHDIKAEFLYKNKPKVQQSFAAIEKDRVPFAVMLAPEEWKAGIVRVKAQLGKGSEEGAGKGDEVKLDKLVSYLKSRIAEMTQV
ncbi:histidyl-tRNA synthetase [Tilletiaria anomala UBC 951]|uniref:histidine--tRNA ligase n=1 Tax=Tilletiaria anomala (strain ATCC 24038 / CBS 436.72 / UBC 951) TaxID=1037660 RepID=A0A066WI38_TILAU|nr:histidyl-tRNA synthetase [Tilletiaria anomala UBC 951]KDN53486.1 histidyl-tRNA synthetase [Tilletiaria anomala UBC 951]